MTQPIALGSEGLDFWVVSEPLSPAVPTGAHTLQLTVTNVDDPDDQRLKSDIIWVIEGEPPVLDKAIYLPLLVGP